MKKPQRYEEFIKFLFDRPITEPEWYFALDDNEFEASGEELADLYIATFGNSASDLAKFSEKQIALGLNYMFNSTSSDMAFFIRDGAIGEQRKIETIQSIKWLYKDCFNRRCAPVLSWIDEKGHNALNGACYMLWDVIPITYLPEERRKSTEKYFAAILDVLENVLYLSNDACVESGLHGLGHMFYEFPEQIARIIDNFILKRPDTRAELLQYAQNARTGHVQ